MTQKTGNSIISILTTMLVISKWSMWFILITAPLAALGAPFLPLQFGADPADAEATAPTFYVGLVLDEEMSRPAYYLETFIVMLFVGAGLYVVHHLQRILGNVRAGAAFDRENGLRLRKIGYAAAIAQLTVYGLWLVSIILDFAGLMEFEGRMITITPMPWIGILGAFALSTIFLEGADIKEEQDLTV